MAAAIGSSIRITSCAPACKAESSTARFSTPVIPEGTAIRIFGRNILRAGVTRLMRAFSIPSAISKSAMTPSFMGRTATIFRGVFPNIAFAL
ncbi:Uncharacterised protein [Chlamydia trachomatis]|nr:Uncharacterised protein [Chlamydia trachomatis]